MSVQKLKKGFTLIELMVVIVIIGILAAIAIPKLFGMSAKAKAQEVGPTVGTWSKLQAAYKMETGHWGSNKQISYKMPGGETGTSGKSETSNFKYEITPATDVADNGTALPTLQAESKFAADDCAEKSVWKAEFKTGDDEPTTTLPTGTGCKALTPNFENIGKKPAAAPPAS